MKTIKVGIWEGHGGRAWDDGSYNGIWEITLKYDRCIDSIEVLYYDKAGKPVISSQKHVSTGGNQTSQVCSLLIVCVIIYFLDIELKLTKNRIDMN